ncbi:MAG: hypothetical protein HGA44_21935 [Cellulomonadaceae bacterium]|nr:hypothetical protein [Cellulomonadaceae bacterium]
MTIWDLLRASVKRWYVILVAVAVGLVASLAALDVPGVYWSRAEVTFLAPTSAINPNALKTTSTDLIVAAGAVARRVNGNITWNQMSDPAATIVGQGELDGWVVRLPDYGGQWSTVYSRQVLDVEVSGATPELVRERQRAVLSRIDEELDGLQAGVRASDLITTTVVPAEPSVYYIRGSAVRALAMIWILCAGGAFAAVHMLELRARPGGRPRAQRPSRRAQSAWRTRLARSAPTRS